jgi:hypothetical protein
LAAIDRICNRVGKSVVGDRRSAVGKIFLIADPPTADC